MPSVALREWRTARSARLEELYAAHAAVGGRGPGRRTATRQLNAALTLQLASEFQGFARDLHDEAIGVIVQAVVPTNAPLSVVLRTSLTHDRALARQNAQPESLRRDFLRLGFDLWPTLRARYRRSPGWEMALTALNHARNGAAHNDPSKIAKSLQAGFPMTLDSVHRWESALNGLAAAMDVVTRNHLIRLTGGAAPWS
jgi:hypothetical protein